MKKVLSIVLSLAMAAGMSATAFAADYAQVPDYRPERDKASVSNGVGTASDSRANAISGSFIRDVLSEGTDTVYIGKNAHLDSNALSALKNAKEPITFKADGYSITIDPKSISDVSGGLNLSMDIDVNSDGLVIQPKESGSFGLVMKFKFEKSLFEGMNISKLKVFYLADDGKVYDYGKVGTDGNNITFSLSHASSYVVTDQVMDGAITSKQNIADNTTGTESNPSTGARG